MLLKEQAGIHFVRWLDPHDVRFSWNYNEVRRWYGGGVGP